MEETFDTILTSILKAIEENPSANIDELIKIKTTELGLSQEGQEKLDETNAYLEAYDEVYKRLQAAKEEGTVSYKWLQNELLSIGDKYNLSDENKEMLIESVSAECGNVLKSSENEVKQALTEVE